ncbi:glutamine--tRNA ligase/YqeY domain fusion protein [Ihubacter massiliensis]|uniref:Glutamine--tRNA ligase n=1 Tax=Hominibacterium faecale TaxID=2839743 RepID=A0A9J6QIF8_9FIRM|nr:MULTISPECIES: glutamine--tRNA ligase/YqeY domain fusion protein [Eubacteriales Family XIII. Incertae Sedis]MCI7301342.1 glutamine--tRNA ligase/YqeY domain fusion protein [Clostridia bacterium]MDY3013329.1 glutamine--tRNA ligase/YqeY domain fusion protein [Clostridiales Family XIII bacterium]MCO7122599.1 glutamine--tRNA ligase/YqeY domain fusion protein [Ihubacter massiliensis]MCU7376873.1 glutamine--tRNA ligase/YqeY domain fusion protein [Hominibacterium faecale]MCU7379422.1 glutamine--tRNA
MADIDKKQAAAPDSASNFIHNIIDKDLENQKYEDRVHTRFPPEPNGYLHIGHAKSICLNFSTAEKYNGKCNLRYDDTNPVKEDLEYVDAIEEDVKWLGFQWDERLWASDYFDKMYEFAIRLIKKGKAFVCDLNADQIREYRGTLKEPGKESPYRNRSVEENLRLFEEMKEGKYADGEKVLRAKIDMASPNINMRDPVIYRISHTEHHNTGGKYCIYPMYDYAHPIEDAIEGITHSICTLEFEDHRPLYDWVLQELEWQTPPQQIEFARLNLTNTVMSKRHLKALVDNGVVDGWDDPRMPTIAGLRRRGYTPEAIRDFCERIGVSKANSTVDVALLEHCVREDLKAKVESRNVVEDPIKIVITNYPEDQTEEMEIENNREVPEMSSRKVPFSRELYVDGSDFMEEPVKKYFRLFPGNEVRFKGAYFITCNDVIKNEDGTIKELHCTYDPATKSGSGFEGRKVKGTIHWVDARTAVKVKIRNYDYLMVENEEGETVLNPDSLTETWGYAEPALRQAQPGERFQFFRHGYYIADAGLTTETEKVFNKIVGLKSSWKK